MALIIEGIFISKTVTVKVHECYIKPLKPREPLLAIQEEDEQEKINYSNSESEDDGDYTKEGIEDLVISDKEVTE